AGLTVKDDAGSIVPCSGDNPTDPVVIGLVADADSVVTYQHDDTAWLGNQLSNHSELFGKISSRQLYVAINFEVLRDMHMTTKHAGEATTRMDRPQGGWSALRLGIN